MIKPLAPKSNIDNTYTPNNGSWKQRLQEGKIAQTSSCPI
jgi:hypothetical protein